MSPGVWIGVAALGGAGAIARFVLDGEIGARVAGTFPWGTFAVNLTGSFVLGALAGASVAGDALMLAGTATIGSFTTFSTWMFETHRLGEEDDRLVLALNIIGSLAAGFLAAFLGRELGRVL